jgi:hypothetical protein
MLTFIIITGWIITSILSYGISFAWFDKLWEEEYPEHKIANVLLSILVSLWGPLSLSIVFFTILIEREYSGIKFWHKKIKIDYKLWDK